MRVFDYGQLGGPLAGLLAGSSRQRRGWVRGTLVRLRRRPGLQLEGQGQVHGVLHEGLPESVLQVLGVALGEGREVMRVRVHVAVGLQTVTAWTWSLVGRHPRARRIPSGRW